MASKNDGIQG